jgi:hypothetical protein
MSNPTAEGRFFEDEMYKVLLSLCDNYDIKVIRENDITKEYGTSCFGIDFLVKGNNFLVLIQSKWENNKPNLDAISKFRCGFNDIIAEDNVKKLSLFVSKLPMTAIGLESFNKIENSFNIYDDSSFYVMFNTLSIMKNKIISFIEEINIPLKKLDEKSSELEETLSIITTESKLSKKEIKEKKEQDLFLKENEIKKEIEELKLKLDNYTCLNGTEIADIDSVKMFLTNYHFKEANNILKKYVFNYEYAHQMGVSRYEIFIHLFKLLLPKMLEYNSSKKKFPILVINDLTDFERVRAYRCGKIGPNGHIVGNQSNFEKLKSLEDINSFLNKEINNTSKIDTKSVVSSVSKTKIKSKTTKPETVSWPEPKKPIDIVAKLRKKPIMEQATLKHNVNNFVLNDSFCNWITGWYNLNSTTNDSYLKSQLEIHLNNPEIYEQVNKWLSS